ncbi:GntR family transcriptional regulator [Clostridia bacterium]|nr:GntR family transcriptional regulator [Clostridia bacterium]
MLLKFEPDSDTPLYLQLRSQIVGGVARGDLLPGDSLPSVRQLAADLGINLHTVSKAYTLLKSEGYVKILGRRGVTIAKPPAYDAAFVTDFTEKLSKLFIEAKSRGVSRETITQIVTGLVEEEKL